MQKKASGEKIFSLFLSLVFLIFVMIALFQYDRQTRMFPLVIGIPGLVLCLFILSSYYIPALGKMVTSLKQKEVFETRADDEYDKEKEVVKRVEIEAREKSLRELNIIMWIIGLLLAIYLFGFIITIPAFIFIFLKFREKESLTTSILITLGSWAIIYLLFIRLLKAQLYSGLFF